MVLYIYLHVARPANSGKGRYLSWGRLTRQVLPGHPGMGKTLWAISQNPLLKQIWPGFLNGNYEKIMLIENSDNEVISIYILWYVYSWTFSIYDIDLYTLNKPIHVVYLNIISSISHRRCFERVQSTGPCHHGPTAECQLRTEVVHLGEWSTWSFLRTNHDTRRLDFC